MVPAFFRGELASGVIDSGGERVLDSFEMSRLVTSDEVIELLLGGGIGVMPTDTVYGLVARAADVAAVERFYAAKPRERKPGTVIAASVEQLVALGVTEERLRHVAEWWPASLSVIVETVEGMDYLHLGLGSLAVRVPADERVRSVLEQTGPLVTTSANLAGQPTAVDAEEAREYFGEAVDFYVAGERLEGRAPSTIVRVLADGGIEVLRRGAVAVDGIGRRRG